MSRFTLTIEGEAERHYRRRSEALAYLRQRQQAGLTVRAVIVDKQTGTTMEVPARYFGAESSG